MARRSSQRSSDDPVLAAQRKLLAEQEKVRQQQEDLSKLLADAPNKIEEQRRRERELKRIRLVTGPANPTRYAVGDKRSSVEKTKSRRRTQLAREKTIARLKFVVLCTILLVIFLSIWKSIPS